MHIVIATIQVPFVFGGAEIHARGLREALVLAGHRVETVSIPFKWYPPERMLDAMLACRLLDLTEANGRKIDLLIGLKFPAYLIPHPNKVLWLLHQHRQAYELYDDPALGDMIHYGNGREVRDAIRRADTHLIPEARAVFTNSANVSRRLRRYCGLDSTPLYHPPSNPQILRCEPAENFFFFPSRINAAKRQHLAIEALALTSGDFGLIFCGESENDCYYQGLQDLVRATGLDSRVEFLGRVSEAEKAELYARCIGVIYPPVDEDYGYVTLEAMLAQKPVLTCPDSGGPLEFVGNWETGVIVEPLAEAMAGAMRRLREEPALAAALGRAGRQAYLDKNITWDHVVETLLAPTSPSPAHLARTFRP